MADNIINFFIFDKDEISSTLIENYLKEVDFSYNIHKFEKFDKDLIPTDVSNFNFIFVDIDKDNDFILDEVAKISVNSKNIFFMMSSFPTTDLYIKALRAGAREFLRKPLEKESFIAAVNNNHQHETTLAEKSAARVGKIVCVTSSEKRCGKTFFAINIAAELARMQKDKVLIIDFNDNLNNITYALDVDQKFDTDYFVQNITAENAKELLSKVNKYKDIPLFVMSGSMYKTQTNSASVSDNLQNFLDIVKRYFRYIIIDINDDKEKKTDVLFLNTDMIFYIITPNIVANSKNKKHINDNFDKKKFRIILNKYREKDENKLLEIENILGREIFYKIPMNLSATLVSSSKGKTIREINPNLEIVKKYGNLAKYIITRV